MPWGKNSAAAPRSRRPSTSPLKMLSDRKPLDEGTRSLLVDVPVTRSRFHLGDGHALGLEDDLVRQLVGWPKTRPSRARCA